MKKHCILLLLLGLFTISLYATPAGNVHQYTLENGLTVFLLEDSSDALVHVETVVKAGFSSQTQNTAGFFYLYSDLIQNSGAVTFDSVSCNADSSRYSVTTTPSKLEQTLQNLSQAIFATEYTDELLIKEINTITRSSEQNAKSLGGFLNSAIESRIYSKSPWKHDTGIYPALFKKNTAKTARSTLQQIADRWYTPQNSAVFISGNFNSERILTSLKNSFGRFYSTYSTPTQLSDLPFNTQKKYVIHSSDFSPDMTQLVIEYTNLSLDECDLFAAALNNNFSTFKQNLISNPELNIPGEDYIDVSAAHTKNSSRLVIQTLLQKPEQKNIITNSLLQTQSFLNTVKAVPSTISSYEFTLAKQQLSHNLKTMTSNSQRMIDTLSSFWAMEPYKDISEKKLEAYPSSYTTGNLMLQSNNYDALMLEPILAAMTAEEPFVFAVVSDADFEKHKKDYLAAGFEEINSKNASWYTMQMYKEIQDQFKPEEGTIYNTKRSDYQDNDYYVKNLDTIKTSTLSNGMKVTTKINPVSTELSLMLVIKGGKINSAKDHGFEEVMINILGTMIQRSIYNNKAKGLILGTPVVTTQTDIKNSYILIDCDQEDFYAVCTAASNAIIYAEIIPAAADRAVSSRQHKKRLENGSAINQLFDAALTTIYGKNDYSEIFDSKKEILQNTNYTKIVNAYPDILDADRYSLIVSGNIAASTYEVLEKNFGQLTSNKVALNNPTVKQSFPKNKAQAVKINHTFLTDIPAEKAGPQPAVLIPTTEFLDPVMYVFQAPEAGTRDYCLFNALLNYLGMELQAAISQNNRISNASVLIQLPRAGINYGFIVIQNVSHIQEVDFEWKKVVEKTTNKMNGYIASEIKNQWIFSQLFETSIPSQAAKLMYRGLELFDKEPAFYLEEYNYISQANAQDYLIAMKLFPSTPSYKLYSKEGSN